MKIDLSVLERFSLRDLPANLSFLYQSAARRDVLKGVQFSLVLFEQRLINTATGESRELKLEEGTSRAVALARAARNLVPSTSASPSILLLLPPCDFVGTSYSMHVNGESLVRSALQLQAHALIPAYEDKLLLGVNARHSEGVAFWYPAARTAELFEAFAERGLFLAALMPRSLALTEVEGPQRVLIHDEDSRNLSVLLMEDDAVSRLLTVSRRDLEQEEFARQWEHATSQLHGERVFTFATAEDWARLRRRIEPRESYCFLPDGSLAQGRRLEAVKRRKFAAGLAAAALVVLCLPFVSNWLQIQRLERVLENHLEMSSQARALQESVLAMEDEWGAIHEYPRQDIVGVLRALNGVIEGTLQSFRLNKGVVDITGFAQDPAFLVTQLAELEEFYNVGQSRTVTSDRFGIRMNVRGVDFESYESRYPLPGR